MNTCLRHSALRQTTRCQEVVLDKSVAELNIAHYRKLLMADLGASKRATIETLLEAEEATLSRIERERRQKPSNLRESS